MAGKLYGVGVGPGRSGTSHFKSTPTCKRGRGDRTSGTGSGGYSSI